MRIALDKSVSILGIEGHQLEILIYFHRIFDLITVDLNEKFDEFAPSQKLRQMRLCKNETDITLIII